MPPPSIAVRAANQADLEAPLGFEGAAAPAYAIAAAAELDRYLVLHRDLLGKAAQPGLAKRIAILAVHIVSQTRVDLETGIRLAATGLRERHNPATLRKCASEARALAGQLHKISAKGSAGFDELVAAAADLSVDRLVRRRADELLGSKGGRPTRRGAAVEAVVRAIDRARQGDPAAANELQMIRQILGARV
jgi:hypothetical protein